MSFLSTRSEAHPGTESTWGLSNAQVTIEEENSAPMTSATLDQTFPEVHAKLRFPFTGTTVFLIDWTEVGGFFCYNPFPPYPTTTNLDFSVP